MKFDRKTFCIFQKVKYDFGGSNIVHARIVKMEPTSWAPAARESAILLSSDTDLCKVILFSGIYQEPMKQLAMLQFKQSAELNWKVLWPQKATSELEIKGRYAAAGCSYKGRFFYFGGAQKYSKIGNIREKLNELIVYDPDTNLIEMHNFNIG